MQITGDNVLIARETARTLGMGTNILTTEGLPEMGPNGEVPKDLGKKYGKWVLEADGFAQVNIGKFAKSSCPHALCGSHTVGEL